MSALPDSVDAWLEHQLRLHPAAIELGLDRVREVAGRLGLGKPARRVITVAGTNGKGSTVAFIEAIARASGLTVGCYTSPHIRRYHERIRIDGAEVDDDALCAAFAAVEAARAETRLTYFEFGTLAALWLFQRAALDLAVLEVGLGGRLDAVNIVDPDVAVVTTIALDHVEHLGPDRESIGREKAGIFRAGRPAIIADPQPPASVVDAAMRCGSVPRLFGSDWQVTPRFGTGFSYSDASGRLELPTPALAARCQPANAGAAIAALRAVPGLTIAPAAWAAGVAGAQLSGRLQKIVVDGVDWWLDVGHNAQAAQQLAQTLRATPCRGSTQAVFSALGDKDIAQLVAALQGVVDAWRLAGLPDVPGRGLGVEQLHGRVAALLARAMVSRHATVAEAMAAAQRQAVAGDRVLVYGSFHTVGQALDWLDRRRANG